MDALLIDAWPGVHYNTEMRTSWCTESGIRNKVTSNSIWDGGCCFSWIGFHYANDIPTKFLIDTGAGITMI